MRRDEEIGWCCASNHCLRVWIQLSSERTETVSITLGGQEMKLFKIAALIVLASLPLLLRKKKEKQEGTSHEYDGIFDQELSAD